MISQRSIGIRTFALCWQVVIVSLSFWIWLYIWQSTLFQIPESLKRYLLYNEFLVVGILFGSGGKREGAGQRHDWVAANRHSFRQLLLGLFCVFLVVFALQDTDVSRSFFFSYVAWLYLTLLFCNYFLLRTLARWAFSGDREERVALVGKVEQGIRLQPWLERKSLLGLRAVGIICPAPVAQETSPFPILGVMDDISEILRKHSITQLIVLDLALGSDWLHRATPICEAAAVRLQVLNNLDDYFNHTTTTFEDDGIRFISLREEPLESPLNRFLKRFLDLVAALPVVILILPLATVLVWILQRAQSPGPIFYAQVRTGMMGKPFTIYKYRTMHVNQNEAKQAAIDDPRVFPAGRWLRKLSIDELPQFINVLKGDMSVVGPRPHPGW